jgi:hypothetical protein
VHAAQAIRRNPAESSRFAAKLARSERGQRLGFGHNPAEGADFVQVAEHLDPDALVQAADPDRFVPGVRSALARSADESSSGNGHVPAR